MKIEKLEIIAPSHWASYLINGDATGFDYYADEEDEKACYDMEESFSKDGYCCVSCEDYGYSRHDYGLPCDCQKYTFIKNVK